MRGGGTSVLFDFENTGETEHDAKRQGLLVAIDVDRQAINTALPNRFGCSPVREFSQPIRCMPAFRLPVDCLMSRLIDVDGLNATLDHLDDGATVREIRIP